MIERLSFSLGEGTDVKRSPEQPESYVLRGGQAGAARLRLINRVKWPTTEGLLGTAGLRAGMRVLDLGCGGGDAEDGRPRRGGGRGRGYRPRPVDPAAGPTASRKPGPAGDLPLLGRRGVGRGGGLRLHVLPLLDVALATAGVSLQGHGAGATARGPARR